MVEPVPGSGATTPNGSGENPGSIPTFNLEAGTADAPSAPPDAESNAAPNPVPNEPNKRQIWSVDDDNHLLRILADDPSNVIDVAKLDLPAGEAVVGLDFRPSNGALYALTSASRLYTIARATAQVTAVGSMTTPLVQGQSIGFDFDPVADTIRIVSDVDQNLRIDPATGAIASTDPTLAFRAEDPNYLQSPNIVGTAYTNTLKPTPASLFGIDSTRNLLVKIENPSDGLVGTVGSLGVDVGAMVGFDIWGSGAATEADQHAGQRIEDRDGPIRLAGRGALSEADRGRKGGGLRPRIRLAQGSVR